MRTLTDAAQQQVTDIAGRHGVSSDAAGKLLAALVQGGGRQAQFDHPELGGMGQWSQGGMIMIGDMFNRTLKAQVAALCDDLAEVAQDPASFDDNPSSDANRAGQSIPAASGRRWPAELGQPAATGSQNDMHYAVFPNSRRLAIERGGQVTVYDTQDHRIGGVSQQQGGEQSLRFTSQSGPVNLSDLEIVSPDAGEAPAEDAVPAGSSSAGRPADDEIFSRIERLAELRSRDIITAEDFAAKKTELLARL